MTRNKKIVIPNVTYSQSTTSGLTKTNLEVAKKALARLNNPKLTNLEKAKIALKNIKHPLYLYSSPSGKNPFYELYKNGDFKVTVDVNQEKDLGKAKLMEELIKQVISWDTYKNYDKNTNKSGNSKSSLRAK